MIYTPQISTYDRTMNDFKNTFCVKKNTNNSQQIYYIALSYAIYYTYIYLIIV
jgi:hypothetical protein